MAIFNNIKLILFFKVCNIVSLKFLIGSIKNKFFSLSKTALVRASVPCDSALNVNELC